MSVALLDVNVLIALAWPMHVHHRQAHDWFAEHAHRGWATCPLTQLGFARISSNPRIIAEAVLPAQARQVLQQMTAHPNHVFWPDTLALSDTPLDDLQILGHRQFTDAYLLALAIRQRGRLATFDDAVMALLPTRDSRRKAVMLIR